MRGADAITQALTVVLKVVALAAAALAAARGRLVAGGALAALAAARQARNLDCKKPNVETVGTGKCR